MAQMESGGNRRSTLSVNLPTVAAISSVLGLLVYAIGFVSGYMVYTRSIGDLLAENTNMQKHITSIETRVTEMQGDIKYTRQDIAELKLAVVPRR